MAGQNLCPPYPLPIPPPPTPLPCMPMGGGGKGGVRRDDARIPLPNPG